MKVVKMVDGEPAVSLLLGQLGRGGGGATRLGLRQINAYRTLTLRSAFHAKIL